MNITPGQHACSRRALGEEEAGECHQELFVGEEGVTLCHADVMCAHKYEHVQIFVSERRSRRKKEKKRKKKRERDLKEYEMEITVIALYIQMKRRTNMKANITM